MPISIVTKDGRMLADRNIEIAPFVLVNFQADCPVVAAQTLNALGFVRFKRVKGFNKNKETDLYFVEFNGPEQLQTLIGLGMDNKQGNFIIGDSERKVELFTNYDSKNELLGTLTNVPLNIAKENEWYLFDEVSNSYFTTL
jgi:hypothetical protein